MAIVNIPDGQEGWGDEVRANFADLDSRVTTAQSTADTALTSAGSAPARPLPLAYDSSQETVIWAGTAGHPYSSVGAAGTFNLNDTSDFVVGSQAISFVTDGLGGQCALGVYGGASMDMRDRILKVTLKVEGQADALDFKVWIGKNAFADSYSWNLKENAAAWPFLREGQWVEITLPLGKATKTGSPDSSANIRALTDFQVVMFDDSTGQVTVHLNKIAFVPEGQGPIVSLTFDDNILGQWTTARPYMDRYGYKGTLYPITGILKDISNPAYVNYFGLDKLAIFQSKGWEVGTHCDSVTLHNQTVSQGGTGSNGYAAYDAAAQAADMREAKNYLIANGFLGVDNMAWPQGAYDETARASAAQFFASCRGLTNPTWESVPVADRLNVRAFGVTISTTLSQMQAAVDQAVAGNEWLIFTFHDVVATPSQPNDVSTADFQALIDYINTSGVPVRTVGQVLADRGRLEHGKTITLPRGDQQLIRVNIPDDAFTSGGPDRVAFWFGVNTRVFALNEYGEARCRPAKNNTIPLKVIGWGGGGTSSGDLFQVSNGAQTLNRFRVSETDAESVVPFKVANNYITINGVRHYTGTTDPDASAPDGSVWFDLTAKVIKVRAAGVWA